MQSAIATSVSLRCYGVLSPRSDDKVALEAPNFDFDGEWDIRSLPWELLPRNCDQSPPTELDGPLLQAIETAAGGSTRACSAAATAFLYLYMIMAGDEREAPALTLTVKANIPVGAGLGSSAAYSTCAASALLHAHGLISASQSGCRLPQDDTEVVNSWAFLSEKVLHGNPSGIDNAVSVRGGAVRFTRAMGGKQGGFENLNGFSAVRLLLTNTLVPRDTKSLVAGVAAKRQAEPHVVDPILDHVQSISDEATTLLSGSSAVERSALVSRLAELMRANHTHLVTLGVSHPALEMVVAATSAAPFGLSTKLTGAGGGGCAVTLIPDEMDQTRLDELQATLRNLGFEPHLTSLGGPGAAVLLSPEGQTDAVQTSEGDTGEGMTLPKRAALRDVPLEGLERWSASQGEWIFT